MVDGWECAGCGPRAALEVSSLVESLLHVYVVVLRVPAF